MSIELHEVSRRFGTTWAVRDLSLHLDDGEIFAFLGPNGAGKTTTIRMICGLLRPTSGQVRVCGHDVADDGSPARSMLAYVPDQPFVYDKLTGREFLHFVARMYDVPDDVYEQRAVSLCEQLQIDSWIDHLAEGYSHGMKQKIVLAATLLHQPRVLVVDEPMVGLDPRTIRTVSRMLTDQAARGTTVFVSTHTLDIAERLADRIGIIHQGRLIALGTFDQLQSHADNKQRLEDVFLELTE